jgi:serine/threonine-protein kinase
MSTSGVHVDARLEGIVQKLLQKDPAKRFATAGDVSREIEKVSPDPARRMLALAKVAGVARRVAMAQSVPDSERLAAALDSAASRRLSAPESPSLATQVSARVPTLIGSPRAAEPPPPRALERPKIARPVLVDLPKTLRSAVPLASAADATPRALPAIRPFPQRHLGKFQVRGPVLRSVDKVVIELFGAEARDEVVSCIPEGWSADLRNDAINALVAYDLELVDAYLEYASALLFRDPGRWREVGRASVDGELHSVVRTLLRPSVELASVLRRGVSTWGRLFSFGTWRVGTAPSGKVALTLGELDAVSMSLRLWIVGMVEQTCRRAVRAELRVIITQGDQDFAPELVCEVG